MQLAHAPGAIVFTVHIPIAMSKVEPGPDHPMHMPKLACVRQLGMLSSTLHSMSILTANLSR